MQARFLIPMAVSLGFGVVFSTVITLVLVPAGYLIMEDLKDAVRRVPSRLLGLRAPASESGDEGPPAAGAEEAGRPV